MSARVAVVTGASRGIGRAICLSLCRQGYDLALVARPSTELQDVADKCTQLGSRVMVLEGDLTQMGWVESVPERVAQQFGGFDVLVNNAGEAYFSAIGDLDLDRWDSVLDLNLRSVMWLTQRSIPILRASLHADIVNIASIASRASYAGGAAYCATKHGLLGLSNALFHDLREDGIRVIAVCPHYVDTRMVDTSKARREDMLSPQDVADTVVLSLALSRRACITSIDLYPQRDPTAVKHLKERN